MSTMERLFKHEPPSREGGSVLARSGFRFRRSDDALRDGPRRNIFAKDDPSAPRTGRRVVLRRGLQDRISGQMDDLISDRGIIDGRQGDDLDGASGFTVPSRSVFPPRFYTPPVRQPPRPIGLHDRSQDYLLQKRGRNWSEHSLRFRSLHAQTCVRGLRKLCQGTAPKKEPEHCTLFS